MGATDGDADVRGTTELVGLVPAAGRGSRVAPLPCSKEVFPVGFRSDAGDGEPRPRVAAHHLLELMAEAGAERAVVVLRKGKWDVPSYFGHGGMVGLDLAYVMMRRPYGVPFTVDDAHAFLAGATVLFGFPDILSEPGDMFRRLLDRLEAGGADVTMAVFPMRSSGRADGVELDGDGGIGSLDPSPGAEASYDHTWIAAAWTPDFTRFLHSYLEGEEEAMTTDDGTWEGGEMSMGDVIRAAVRHGVRVEPVVFEDGSYVDIGTPEDLAWAVRTFAREE